MDTIEILPRYDYRVLATVKNSMLNAVFPITLRSQFPNLDQQKIVIL
jgi:hypothetical protein